MAAQLEHLREPVRAAYFRSRESLARVAAAHGVPRWVAARWSAAEGGWSRRRRAGRAYWAREISVRDVVLAAIVDVEERLGVSWLRAVREVAAHVALAELAVLRRRAEEDTRAAPAIPRA